jgi:nitroreductase
MKQIEKSGPQDFYELIKTRRSIRKFRSDPVPKTTIEKILNAAIEAPSGKNRQNWRFYVVTGEKRNQYLTLSQKSWLNIKDILKERLKPSLYDFTERFFFTLGEAPVIVFCYSQNSVDEKYLTSIGSVYMAVQNLNLAAFAEGLGCCTMGAPLEIKDEVDRFLDIKAEKNESSKPELLCAVAMGWPDHSPPKAARSLDKKVTWLD